MAERRMFAKTIIDSDAFLDMPLSSQALYFHLAMRADDDGFLNNANKIMKIVGAQKNDIDLLIAKRFVLTFPDGICVIKHWRIHNYIRNDRYKETVYLEQKAALLCKENGSYSFGIPPDNQLDTVGIPNDTQLETQVRLGKDSIGKESKKALPRHSRGENGWVKLTDKELTSLVEKHGQAIVDYYIQYIDESAQISRNKNKWQDWNRVIQKAIREKWGRPPEQSAIKVFDPVGYMEGK